MRKWVPWRIKISAPTPIDIFFLVFSWSLLAGIFIQWVVLPAMPGLYAGHGLMKGGDWVWFHNEATKLAEVMRRHGWQAWELRPYGNAPIGIAAAVYFLAGIS